METTIEVKVKATSPCAKFLKANLRDQLQKIKEEVNEVEEALEGFLGCNDKKDYALKEAQAEILLMEMYDVTACVNTLHAQLKYRFPGYFNEAKNAVAEAGVIQKNMARGYYALEEE